MSNSKNKNCFGGPQGFTLVELLVVIAVIGILVGMLFPAVQAVRGVARRSACSNNLRQITLGIHGYEASHSSFPITVDANGGSFYLELAPFIDQEYVYRRFREKLDTGNAETWQDRFTELSNVKIPLLHCPAVSKIDHNATILGLGKYTTQYYGIAGPVGNAVSSDAAETYSYDSLAPEPAGGPVSLEGVFSPNSKGKYSFKRGFEDIRDGKSNTLAFGEIAYPAERSNGDISQRAGWAFGAKYGPTGVVEKNYIAKTFNHQINEFAEGTINDPA
ncbi:MAG: DUF1559 domain-containing protein, partial [Planctomycetota bacterium]